VAAEVAYETVEVPKGIERPRRINGARILRIFVTFSRIRSITWGGLAGSHKPANLGGGGSRRASSAPAKPAKAPAKKSTPKAPVQPQVRAKHCQDVDHHGV